VEKVEGNSEFIIQNSPTYHLQPTTYQILTTFLFTNIPALKG
jgi:hypothetical protein